jgi:hypothetical protein
MSKYLGYMYVSGEFIKSNYDKYYTKEELDAVDVEEMYEIEYFEPPAEDDDKYLPRWFAKVAIKIPDINDDIKVFEFNTSSRYALEVSNYEFIEADDDYE